MEEMKDNFKDKKFQNNILIGLVVFIIVILLLNWLIKSEQANRDKNQAENFNAYYKELLQQCGKGEKADNCCFNSVAYMAANNLKTAGIGCDFGFKLNTFACPGSYKWCEMIR